MAKVYIGTYNLSDLEKGKMYYVRNGNEYDQKQLFMRPEFRTYDCPEDGEHEMTADERKAIIKGLRWGRAQFEKRLNTYLKRYGVSKIHTWTYWADA